jgi:hypothetical protein
MNYSVHRAYDGVPSCIRAKYLYGERLYAFGQSEHSTFRRLVVGTDPNVT